MPADALLYDQNVLDWVLAGELTGDREYIGRGFVHSARGLTDWEKQFIQWTFEPAKERSPLNGMSSGVYDQEYTLRYLSYGAQDSSKADEATAKARAEAAAKGGNEHPKKYSCSACDAHPGGGGDGWRDGGKVSAATSRPSPIIERMIKAPPWLFSAESDVYKNPKMAKRSPGYRGGDRVVGRYWGATPPPTALVHFVCTRWPGSDGRKIGMRLLRRWYVQDIAWVRDGASALPAPSSTPLLSPRLPLTIGSVQRAQADATAAATAAAAGGGGAGAAGAGGGAGGGGAAGGGASSKLPMRRPSPPLIAFASPIPLGDGLRDREAKCSQTISTSAYKGASPCAARWKPMRALPWDRQMLETWHKLLAILAVVTERKAVIPLFQCTGILDPRGRFGWTLHAAPPPPPAPPSSSPFSSGGAAGASVRPAAPAGRPRRGLASWWAGGGSARRLSGGFHPHNPLYERTACTFRLGEGCFSKLGYPEEIARLPREDTLQIEISADVIRAGGVPALLREVLGKSNSSRASGLLIDLQAAAMALSEDTIRAAVDHFLSKTRPEEYTPPRRSPTGVSATSAHSPLSFLGIGRRLQTGQPGDGSRLRNATTAREEAEEAKEEEQEEQQEEEQEQEEQGTAARRLQGRGGGRGGGGRGGGGRGAAGRLPHDVLARRAARFPLPTAGGFPWSGGGWTYRLGQATCNAMIRIYGQPYVC